MPKIGYRIILWASLTLLIVDTIIFIMLVHYNMVHEVVVCLETMVACGLLLVISCWKLSKFARIETTVSKAEVDKDL
jgi:hypothetical protein